MDGKRSNVNKYERTVYMQFTPSRSDDQFMCSSTPLRSNTPKFIAEDCDRDKRIDHFLTEKQKDFTRSALERLFYSGKILVNGQSRPKSYKLKAYDEIEITLNEALSNTENNSVGSQNLPINIVYEDEYILVVDKPKGMIVHPSATGETGTLVNALLFHCGGRLSNVGDPLRPGIVHRIDKDTSGLIVAAKTNAAHKMLAEQAEAHTMTRKYEGVVHGNLKSGESVIDAPIGRHPIHRTKNCVLENGRRAVTHYRVIQRLNGFTHMEFTLETGRMHQIRVHMAHLGHPVAGDLVYGASKQIKSLHGQCLHAKMLGFTHPETLERMEFTTVLPKYFTDFLAKYVMED